MYPSLSFSTSHGLNYRPFQQYSNTVNGIEIISSDQRATYNGNYGINANWTVWSGNRNRNSLRQANNRRQMAEMSVEETENLLREDVARLYVQILYAKENLITCDSACVLSRKNLERGSVLLESGAISKTDFSQLESQVSSDDYQRVLAYNELQNYTLQLRQLLDLGEDTAFSVLTLAFRRCGAASRACSTGCLSCCHRATPRVEKPAVEYRKFEGRHPGCAERFYAYAQYVGFDVDEYEQCF